MVQSSLMALFAIMNQSLKSNFEIDPQSTPISARSTPDFVKGGTLTVENLAEGKFSRRLRRSVRTRFPTCEVRPWCQPGEVWLIREQVFATSGLEVILNRAKNKSAQFKQGLSNAKGSPVAMAEFLMKEAKAFKSSVRQVLPKTSSEINDSWSPGPACNTMVKDGSGKTLGFAIQELNTIESKLEHYITLTQNDIEQKTHELQQARDGVAQVSVDGKMQRAANKELELFIRVGTKNLNALSKVKESVEAVCHWSNSPKTESPPNRDPSPDGCGRKGRTYPSEDPAR